MDWAQLVEVIDVVTRILGAVAIVLIFVMGKTFVTHEELTNRFNEHDKVHNKVDERLSRGDVHFVGIETEAKHAPTHEDIEGLRRDITELKATVAGLDAGTEERALRMVRIEANVDRLLDFQLNGGGR